MGRFGRLTLTCSSPAKVRKDRSWDSAPEAKKHKRHETSLLYSLYSNKFNGTRIAGAIGYLDDKILPSDMNPTDIKATLLEGLPFISNVLRTSWGDIVTFILPRFQSEIYMDEAGLIDDILDVLRLAKTLGIQYCSLTGLIPSATGNGRRIMERLECHPDWKDEYAAPTTGHATTTACIVLSTIRIMEEAKRYALHKESVAFLGLGSVGMASLKLFLTVLPHPKSIMLCDLRRADLEKLRDECVLLGFKGTIELVVSTGQQTPDAVYNNTIIIGATNIANVLDTLKLKSGTLIVDDSAPHCFDAGQLVDRIRQCSDILVTEGGPLRMCEEIEDHFYFPKRWEMLVKGETGAGAQWKESGLFDTCRKEFEIMGCMFSALLSTIESSLPPTIGCAPVADCEKHFRYLSRKRIRGCDLSLDGNFFEKGVLESFVSNCQVIEASH